MADPNDKNFIIPSSEDEEKQIDVVEENTPESNSFAECIIQIYYYALSIKGSSEGTSINRSIIQDILNH